MNNEQYRAQYASKTFPLCSDRLSRFSRRMRKRRPFDVTAGEGQKCRPVRAGGVTAAMLAPGQIAVYERSLHGRKFRRPKILLDRKSTRLNSSHLGISYAVFCLKK